MGMAFRAHFFELQYQDSIIWQRLNILWVRIKSYTYVNLKILVYSLITLLFLPFIRKVSCFLPMRLSWKQSQEQCTKRFTKISFLQVYVTCRTSDPQVSSRSEQGPAPPWTSNLPGLWISRPRTSDPCVETRNLGQNSRTSQLHFLAQAMHVIISELYHI